MTDPVALALIAAVPPTLAALGALLVSLRNRKNAKADIQAVHVLVNSRMTELLDATRGQAKSEGKAEGKEQERGEERDRQADAGRLEK